MLQSYSKKYNTPRVYQILSTIAFVILPLLMYGLNVFRFYDPFDFYSPTWTYSNIFYLYCRNFSYEAGTIAELITFAGAAAGITFIWLNRPKISGICGGALLLVMLMSMLRIWDIENYYVVGYRETTFLQVSVQNTYYVLWAAVVLLAVFLVLSIKNTKAGPRPPKVVKVMEVSPAAVKSSADEIKKFKDLYDAGVITQEEFDAKKKEILGL